MRVRRIQQEFEEELRKARRPSGCLGDLEQLRKTQEQLFDIVNTLRQEIEEEDSVAPARLVFKRNTLTEEYSEALQVKMSREVHQRIREAKKSEPVSIYFSNQSDIRIGQNSTILLEEDSIMLPLQKESSLDPILIQGQSKPSVGV